MVELNTQYGMSVLPIAGQTPLPGFSDSSSFANLTAADLLALIDYRNRALAQQGSLAREQMGQQGSQFDQQLAFNTQAQRAQEHLGLTQQQLAALSQASAEGLSRQGLALQGFGAAETAGLGRQSLAMQGFSEAERARLAAQTQQENQALQIAQLVASLRGPSNAFKQLEVNMGLNRAGQSNLLGALAGEAGVPAYRAAGGVPEAATLGTMARDAGATPGVGYPSTSTAGIQGLLALASQNAGGSTAAIDGLMNTANANAAIGAGGGAGSPYAEALRVSRDMEAGRRITMPGLDGPVDAGSQIIEGFKGLLRDRNGVVPAWDDPGMLALYKAVGLSDAQARTASWYAHEYAKSGVYMHSGSLNDMIEGQIRLGIPPDDTKWRPGNQPGGAQGRPIGAQPIGPFQPPPAAAPGAAPAPTVPGQTAPTQPTQPTPAPYPSAPTPAGPIPGLPDQPPAGIPGTPGATPVISDRDVGELLNRMWTRRGINQQTVTGPTWYEINNVRTMVLQNQARFQGLSGEQDFDQRVEQLMKEYGKTVPMGAVQTAQPQAAAPMPAAAPPQPAAQAQNKPNAQFTWNGSAFVGDDGSQFDRTWNRIGGGSPLSFGTPSEAARAAGGEKPGWDYTDQNGRFVYGPRAA